MAGKSEIHVVDVVHLDALRYPTASYILASDVAVAARADAKRKLGLGAWAIKLDIAVDRHDWIVDVTARRAVA
jgi:hypothetical protein